MSAFAVTPETMLQAQKSESVPQHSSTESQLTSAIDEIKRLAEDLKKGTHELTRDLIDMAKNDFKTKAKHLARVLEVKRTNTERLKNLQELDQGESEQILSTMFGKVDIAKVPPKINAKDSPNILFSKMQGSGTGAFSENRPGDLTSADSLSWFESFVKSPSGKEDLFINISRKDKLTSLSIQAVSKPPDSLAELQSDDYIMNGPKINFLLNANGQLVRTTLTVNGQESLIPVSQHQLLARYLGQMEPNRQLNSLLDHEKTEELRTIMGIQEQFAVEKAGGAIDHVVYDNRSELTVTINGKIYKAIGDKDTTRSKLWGEIKNQKDFPRNDNST